MQQRCMQVVAIVLTMFLTLNIPVYAGHNEGSSYVFINGPFIRIGNSLMEIVITLGNNTGGGIYAIIDKKTGIDFIQNKKAVGQGFYNLVYWAPKFNRTHAMMSRNSKVFNYSYEIKEGIAYLHLYWKGLSSTEPDISKYFNVTVNVTVILPPDSSLSYWYITVDSDDPTVIEGINFPVIDGVFLNSSKYDDYLAFPTGIGALLKNPAKNMKPNMAYGGDYPGISWTLQFFAYYSKRMDSGLYLATYDTSGQWYKHVTIRKSGDGTFFSIYLQHTLEFQPRLKLTLPYPVVIGIFHGDWYDAAMIYKNWAEKQYWTSRGTIHKTADIPAWLKKVGISADVLTRYWARNSQYWNGPYSNVPLIAKVMKRYFGTEPLLSWRGWERDGFACTEPIVLPPSEGYASFKRTINNTHNYEGRVLVIPVTSSYTSNVQNWKHFAKYAPRKRNGALYMSHFVSRCNPTDIKIPQTLFIMAPNAVWKKFLTELTENLTKLGVDIIQLDGNPIMPFIDYYGNSGHLGGGNWWVNEYQGIFREIKRRIREINSKIALGAEWISEPYLSIIDASNEQINTGIPPQPYPIAFFNSSFNRYIPLWHVLYHEYQVLYSTITFVDGRDRMYYLRGLAISLIYGEIPMVGMDPQGTGPPYDLSLYDPEMLQYAKRIAEARSYYAYPYLVEGKMLRPPRIIGNIEITIPGVNSIPYSGGSIPSFKWPAVMSSVWKSPDGSFGIVVTNINKKSLNVTLDVSKSIKLKASQRYIFCTIANGKITKPQIVRGDMITKIPLKISPLEVKVMEVIPINSNSYIIPPFNKWYLLHNEIIRDPQLQNLISKVEMTLNKGNCEEFIKLSNKFIALFFERRTI